MSAPASTPLELRQLAARLRTGVARGRYTDPALALSTAGQLEEAARAQEAELEVAAVIPIHAARQARALTADHRRRRGDR